MDEQYKTIEKASIGEFKDRGSKFIGYAFPLNTIDESKALIQQVRKEHPKARHHCFAYRLGWDKNNYRFNDDGEPSGTAGKPILGQIDSFNLTNVLIMVVRYFGGTLLGTSGLINAYRETAKEALQHAYIIECSVMYEYTLQFTYTEMPEIMNWVKKENIEIGNQNFADTCVLIVRLDKSKAISLKEKWADLISHP